MRQIIEGKKENYFAILCTLSFLDEAEECGDD